MSSSDYPPAKQAILFESDAWANLKEIIQEKKPSQLFILVDSNTKERCLPLVLKALNSLELEAQVLEVPAGEKSKDLEICSQLWQQLTEFKADRFALLINLGGGMISDLGGFVASIYKRGIEFVNVPTSLLGMIDASIGGKCGIDFMHYKNHLGVFQMALSTLIFPEFLKTLPQIELKSGFAEAIKHALIADAAYWQEIKTTQVELWNSQSIIERSIEIKSSIVSQDPLEKGERKKLNFGHTLGHAVESYYFEKGEPIPHGFAIAAGMIMEGYLSCSELNFSQQEFNELLAFIQSQFGLLDLTQADIPQVIDNLIQDKKNRGGEVRFCLLSKIGEANLDLLVNENQIQECLKYYIGLK